MIVLPPELGCFSLSEIRAVRLPYGLWIERQPGFSTPFPLSVWAETVLRRAADSCAAPDLPFRSGKPDGG